MVALVTGLAAVLATSFVLAQDVTANQAENSSPELTKILQEVRDEFNLPALAAAVVIDGKLLAYDAVGVRKRDDEVAVTRNDQFHIGSCTKAMTATLLARLIDNGQISESLTIGEAFPQWKGAMLKEYLNVTLPMLVSHWAGFPPTGRSWPDGMSHQDVRDLPGAPSQQRLEYVRRMLLQKPVVEPGTSYSYSNAGYTVVAVMIEQALDTSWEKLIQKEVFDPLQMKSAGLGAMGTPGKIDQPWQHRALPVVSKLTSRPIEPGPSADNPVSIHPGGGVHCSVSDWSQFVIAHLTGKSPSGDQYLSEKSLQFLHTPFSEGDYAAGWMVLERGWGDGTVLHHNGTNTMNFAIAWVAPKRKFAVLVATNQAGSDEPKACDRVASSVIRQFLADR